MMKSKKLTALLLAVSILAISTFKVDAVLLQNTVIDFSEEDVQIVLENEFQPFSGNDMQMGLGDAQADSEDDPQTDPEDDIQINPEENPQPNPEDDLQSDTENTLQAEAGLQSEGVEAFMSAPWDGVTIADSFDSGDGLTLETAFVIRTAAQLALLAKRVNDGNSYAGNYFVLADDIHLGGKSWTPIGTAVGETNITSGKPFSGTLDGKGFSIEGLYIDSPKDDYRGLFGYIKHAGIKNLSVNGSVLGRYKVGMLAGCVAGSTAIDACTIAGTVKTTQSLGHYVGGMVGAAVLGDTGSVLSITNINSSANVSTQGHYGYNVGGMIGWINVIAAQCTVTIESCTVTGDVKTEGDNGYNVGGIVGAVEVEGAGSVLSIKNINASATVMTQGHYGYNVGGMAGWIHVMAAQCAVTIENCTVVGDVKTEGTHGYSVGGMVGEIYFHAKIGSLVNAGELTISGCVTKGQVLTKGAQGNNVGGLIGIISVYSISHIAVSNIEILIYDCRTEGDVNAAGIHVYGAYTGGLIGFTYLQSSVTNSSITVERCSASGNVSAGAENKTHAYYVGGLIGHTYTSNLSNSYNTTMLLDSYATGSVQTRGSSGYYVGGLVGFAEIAGTHNTSTSSIVGCYATGDVTAFGELHVNYIGGLVGHMHNGQVIKNSYATGDVAAMGAKSYTVGGLVGYAYGTHTANCRIENSYATGNVTCKGSNTSLVGSGGLVGFSDNTDIKNSYATGRVDNPSSHSGALIGQIYSTSYRSARIENCYATGTVVGNTNSGGFVGAVNHLSTEAVTFENCFYDTTTTAQIKAIGTGTNNTSGAIVPKNTAAMTEVATFASWGAKNNWGGKSRGTATDASPWYIDDDITYPYLYYQYDGHSKAETNYNLGSCVWITTGGESSGIFDRTDFGDIAGQGSFRVTTGGAKRVYFPYAQGRHQFGAKEIVLPGSSFSAASYPLYSLGGVSATNIIAFINSPTTEKQSDRVDFDQDNVTDTYPGDIVTYSILVNNLIPECLSEEIKQIYDRVNTWRDIRVEDPLAAGVTFISDSVTISYDGGETSFAAASGTEKDMYYFDAETGNGVLHVYLQDLPPETNALITFQVVVEKAAVGNSIRNQGSAEGTLSTYDGNDYHDYLYQTDFDDYNDDPVQDTYQVHYYGNGGITATEETQVKYVYPVADIAPSHTVKSNNELKFALSGYTFLGWNSSADGSGEIFTPGQTLTLSGSIALYAQWGKDLRLRKVDTDTVHRALEGTHNVTALSGAEFALYICSHAHDADCGGLQDADACLHAHTDLMQAGSCWIDAGYTPAYDESVVIFPGLLEGTYLLVETKAPNEYQHPEGQWIIVVSAKQTIDGHVLKEIALAGIIGDADLPALCFPGSRDADIDLWVSNSRQYRMPLTGENGEILFKALGLSLVAGGIWFGLSARKKRRRVVNMWR